MPTESPKKRKLPSHWIKPGQETDSTDMDIDEYFSSANSDIDTASEMSWSPTDNTTFFSQPKKRKLLSDEDAEESEDDNEENDTNLLTNDLPSDDIDNEDNDDNKDSEALEDDSEDKDDSEDNDNDDSEDDDEENVALKRLLEGTVSQDSQASDTTNEKMFLSEYYVISDEDPSDDSEIEKLKQVFGYDDTDLQDEPTKPSFKDLFGYSESEDDEETDNVEDTLDQMNIDTEEDFNMVFKELKLK